MKKLLTILILTATGLVALPAITRAADEKEKAAAPQGERPARLDPEARLKMMTEKLGLNEEQQGKIKAIYEKNGPKIKEIMAKGRENFTDEDKAKLRELNKAQQEEVAAVLTPEQKEKMKELRPAGGGRAGGAGGEKPAKPGDPK